MKIRILSALFTACIATAHAPARAQVPPLPSPAVTQISAPVPVGSQPTVQTAAGAKTASKPAPDPAILDHVPTTGDWMDLAQRNAYKQAVEKYEGKDKAAPTQAELPTLPLQTQLPYPNATEKKRAKFSQACPDNDSPCFFSVYGMRLSDGTNNFHGQFAWHGRAIPVYRGKQFDGNIVVAITDSEMTTKDSKGRKHVWPLYAEGDYAADPNELSLHQTTLESTDNMSVHVGPPNAMSMPISMPMTPPQNTVGQ